MHWRRKNVRIPPHIGKDGGHEHWTGRAEKTGRADDTAQGAGSLAWGRVAKRSALVTHALQATTAHTAEASIATAVQTNSVRVVFTAKSSTNPTERIRILLDSWPCLFTFIHAGSDDSELLAASSARTRATRD